MAEQHMANVSVVSDSRSANGLLALVPESEYHAMAPSLRLTPLPKDKVLFRQGEPIERVYFPSGGLCSVRRVMEDGHAIDVAKIGREGMIGPLPFGPDNVAIGEACVQVADAGAREMEAVAFKRCLQEYPTFRELIDQYSFALVNMVAQAAACSGIHSVEERFCCNLLLAADRMRQDDVPLTQDVFARMLGVRRPTVTVVMSAIHRSGLIEYRRGKIRVLDRERLKSVSCECYRVMSRQVGEFGVAPRKSA